MILVDEENFGENCCNEFVALSAEQVMVPKTTAKRIIALMVGRTMNARPRITVSVNDCQGLSGQIAPENL